MQEQLERRLTELKTEFEAGQQLMTDLEARQKRLRETLLRISGAIQVLEEMLAAHNTEDGNGASTLDSEHAFSQVE